MSRITLSAAALTLALSGCATIQLGDKAEEAQLKKFEPVPGKTSLYVCREGGYLTAGGVRSTIYLDGTPIGNIKPWMFVHQVVAPGKHVVSMKNDGIAGHGNELDIETKADEVSFVWVGVTGHGFGILTEDFFPNVEAAKACVNESEYAVAPKE